MYSGNPGGSLTDTRNVNRNNLVSGVGSDQWPMLFRERSRLTPGSFPDAPTYPITSAVYAETAGVTIFEPNIKTPYAQSWQFGIQRELNKSMAIEVRYVGTRSLQGWTGYNFNSSENNMLENGVMDEFYLAMLNLQANVANGKSSSGFRYLGPGTGTYPLPISLAWFNGLPASAATNPSSYSGSNWTTSTNLGYLNKVNPNPGSYAGVLHNDATKRANGAKAGMPVNFFMVNPNLRGGATIQGNGGSTDYDSMVVELRRRMSRGLLVQANYTWAKAFGTSRYTFRRDRINDISTGTLPHTFKLNWVMELPFGKGRRFGGGAGTKLDYLVGGWEFHGIFRIQSGDWENFGSLQLNGMTPEELQSIYKLRFDDANRIIYQLPDDIIQNTIKAHSFSPTSATGFSGEAPTGRYFAPARQPNCIALFSEDCAPRNLYIRGPHWNNVDMSLVKQIRFTEQKNFELRAEFLNALNEVNFNYINTGCVGSSVDICQVTGTQGGPRRVQIVMRFNF
jgi:hypothetical protein